MSQIEYMYPDKEIPLLPKGIHYRKDQKLFEVRKDINKSSRYIRKSTKPHICVMLLERFCDENGLNIK